MPTVVNYASLTIGKLRTFCVKASLGKNGTKPDLVARLEAQAAAKASQAAESVDFDKIVGKERQKGGSKSLEASLSVQLGLQSGVARSCRRGREGVGDYPVDCTDGQ